jgi:hypothetical protein
MDSVRSLRTHGRFVAVRGNQRGQRAFVSRGHTCPGEGSMLVADEWSCCASALPSLSYEAPIEPSIERRQPTGICIRCCRS